MTLSPAGRSTARIVVLEDGRGEVSRTSWTLKEAGYDVATAPNFESLQRVLAGPPADLILVETDPSPPDAQQALQRVRAQPFAQGISVLFLSPAPPPALDGTNDEHLAKPVTREALLNGVRVMLNSRRAHRALARTARMLMALNQASQKIASILEPEPLIDFVVDSLHRQFHFQHVHVLLELGPELMVAGATSSGLEGKAWVSGAAPGTAALALKLERMVRSEEMTQEPAPLIRGAPHALAIPFRSADGARGCIELSSERPLQLEESDALVLHTLAEVMAVGLNNARLYRSLSDVASRDELTGLLNRRTLFSLLEAELSRAQRYKHPLTVAAIDIDKFKHINDTLGHAVGDIALKTLGKLLINRLRTHDLVGRIGGDEFVLVLPETDTPGAQMVCQRLLEACRNQRVDVPGGTPFQLNISMGYAVYPAHSVQDGKTLVKLADEALYRAKHAGRNGFSS